MPNSVFITGPHGCGKTTLAKRVAKEFGLKFASAGDIRAEIALSRGYETMEEWNTSTEPDKNTCVDNLLYDIVRNPQNHSYSFDTHIGNFFWYEAGNPADIVTLYLHASPIVGAKRINDHLEENPDVRPDEPRGLTVLERMALLEDKMTIFFRQLNYDRNKVFKGFIPDFRDAAIFTNPFFFEKVIETDQASPDEVYKITRAYLIERELEPAIKLTEAA